MSDIVKKAFERVCDEHETSARWYVTLYREIPFYGGPQEGGWWGCDVETVAFKSFLSHALAMEAAERVWALAKELNEQARQDFGKKCLTELDAAERRGMDPGELREVDGEDNFYVAIEQNLGNDAKRGSRTWE